MKTVGAFEAKTHFSELLNQVARGESVLITKRGKPVASLAPVTSGNAYGPRDRIAAFRKKFAKSLRHYSFEEIAELRDTGKR